MNVEIVEIVNLGARSVGLSRIHFFDDPQRKRSKNNKDYSHIERRRTVHRANLRRKYRNLSENTYCSDLNDRGYRDESNDM